MFDSGCVRDVPREELVEAALPPPGALGVWAVVLPPQVCWNRDAIGQVAPQQERTVLGTKDFTGAHAGSVHNRKGERKIEMQSILCVHGGPRSLNAQDPSAVSLINTRAKSSNVFATRQSSSESYTRNDTIDCEVCYM
jgi:hypothetical protein